MSVYAVDYLTTVGRLYEKINHAALDSIFAALLATYDRDGQIFVCGNGGSASSASHFACDLNKWTILPGKRRVRAIAVTDNMALLSAWANDSAYERVFAEQLSNFMRPGDMLLAISGSGNSPNVLHAVNFARELGCPTAGLSGYGGGKLAQLVDHPLVVDSYTMPQVEDVHLTICHLLATQLRVALEQRDAQPAQQS